jgi:hypothetical protein
MPLRGLLREFLRVLTFFLGTNFDHRLSGSLDRGLNEKYPDD